MSTARVLARHARPLPFSNACAFCQARHFTPFAQGNVTPTPLKRPEWQVKSPVKGLRQTYATAPRQKLDVKRLRTEVDERARVGYYTLTKKQGVMHIDPATANSIAKEFLNNEKKMEPVENIKRLSASAFHPPHPSNTPS